MSIPADRNQPRLVPDNFTETLQAIVANVFIVELLILFRLTL